MAQESANRPCVLYIAATIDGYIADENGGIEWLTAFDVEDYGYDQFIAGVDTVIMGRATYNQVLGFDQWPYANQKTIVLSSREIDLPAASIEGRSGNVSELMAALRAEPGGTIWLCGGGKTIRAFLDHDLVDRIELFVMPLMLGRGLALFPPSHHQIDWKLESSQTYSSGVVRMNYVRRKDDATPAATSA